ncbi:hypothetical protein AQUSIP_09950 [Aquicella siphonis]|uniref:GtrA/DPMS transmembrane domain-containing protein n=1 Tax=Aquicella siphonis TaxID=254247 RepID=A0A5E4PGE1_9COXI|nr:GtrA family protein [Aquicella siphonis]VVC75705.1 hypothetical protein AQUSIP_09950 [Aquicella siphonis]
MNKIYLTVNAYLPLLMQLFRFGIVGLSAAAIHFGTVVLMVQGYTVPPLVANIFGFAVSFQMSYWGHRLWTFQESSALHRIAFPRLLFVQIVNFAANEALFFLFLAMKLPYMVALVIVLTVLPVFTFISSKLWVFR